jgi:hypothetical protein
MAIMCSQPARRSRKAFRPATDNTCRQVPRALVPSPALWSVLGNIMRCRVSRLRPSGRRLRSVLHASFRMVRVDPQRFQSQPKTDLESGLRDEYNCVPYEAGERLAGIINEPNFVNPSLYLRMVLNPQPIYRRIIRAWGPDWAWPVKFSRSQSSEEDSPFSPIFRCRKRPISKDSTSPSRDIAPRRISRLPPPLEPSPSRPSMILSGNVVPTNGNSKSVPPNDPINLTPYGPRISNQSQE